MLHSHCLRYSDQSQSRIVGIADVCILISIIIIALCPGRDSQNVDATTRASPRFYRANGRPTAVDGDRPA